MVMEMIQSKIADAICGGIHGNEMIHSKLAHPICGGIHGNGNDPKQK